MCFHLNRTLHVYEHGTFFLFSFFKHGTRRTEKRIGTYEVFILFFWSDLLDAICSTRQWGEKLRCARVGKKKRQCSQIIAELSAGTKKSECHTATIVYKCFFGFWFFFCGPKYKVMAAGPRLPQRWPALTQMTVEIPSSNFSDHPIATWCAQGGWKPKKPWGNFGFFFGGEGRGWLFSGGFGPRRQSSVQLKINWNEAKKKAKKRPHFRRNAWS